MWRNRLNGIGSNTINLPFVKQRSDILGPPVVANRLNEVNQVDTRDAWLAAIVESSDDAIITKDLNGTITSWNRGAERIFGYCAEEIIGKPISILIPPDRQNEEPGILARLRHGQRIDHYETVRQRKDGTLLDISLTVSPLRNSEGKIVGASKIARDITAQKRGQQALRESEERLRAVVDNISQMAWTATESGDVTWYNRRWYEYTGTIFDKVKGRGWTVVHHPDHFQRVVANFEESLRTGRVWEDTFPLRGKDGQYRWFLSRASPIRDSSGKIQLWFGTNTDITELQEAREAQTRLHEELERRVAERTASLTEAIAQMEEFSYSVSHDLRAPVRAMQGYAQATLEDYGHVLGEQGRDYLNHIVRSGERMDRLVRELLVYSRIARAQLELQPVLLDRLVRDIVSHYPEMQQPQAEIRTRGSLHSVIAHEPSLTQAISNLLNNAVKFVEPGVKPEVELYSERQGNRLRLWIHDNGIGIKPEYRARLFGLFERIHNGKQYEGTGIGLAIVRKSVERMGGKVGMESNGKGSRFWIELPSAETGS
jgi:PAS domain S-box-containing protein